MLWENIKVVFSVVAEVLGGFFKAAWEVIKIVWDVVVSYFAAIWNSIAGVFSVVKNVLQGNWSEAWEGIKGIVNTWKDFFVKIWNSIKGVFSVVGTFFKDAFSTAWEGVKKIFANVGEFFTGIWNTIKNIFSKVGSSIASAVSSAFTTAINWVLEKAIGIINGFIGAINSAIGIINKIPGVNITKLSKLSVPKLAKGGVIDSATVAMIGEAGKEAVVPLENNTEWMDKLADRLAARSQTPTKVILKVGEKELGWATIGAINGITEQTGGLQLAL
jgi:phage-related protein